jgi:hypothetical protein
MRTAIDDFPSVGVSAMRAAGFIHPADETATVVFPAGQTFTVPLTLRQFPKGGNWSFFLCPCGRRCRTMRLYSDGSLACRTCLKAKGYRNRVELIQTDRRADYHLPRLLVLLSAPKLRRRVHFERRLRRSLIVAKQAALDEHDKRLARL